MRSVFFLSEADLRISPYIGQYDPVWVLASFFIVLVSSTCAIEMSRRLSDVASRRLWLPMIALVMGTGIWAMHFVGMLAFKLECGVRYEPWITALSILPGMAAAVVALNDAGRDAAQRSASSFLVPALILGSGIGVMHYSGMAAMVFDGIIRYEPVLLLCSVLLAVLFSFVALRLNHTMRVRRTLAHPFLASLASGAVLALAITSMHYCAMEAAYFLPTPPSGVLRGRATPTDEMAAWVLWISLGLILSCLLLTYISTRFAAARQRIEAILAASTQSFVQLDSEGRITDCNAAMAQLWGQSRESLLGLRFVQLFDEAERFTPGATEAVLMRPTLGRLHCLVTFNEVRNDHGQVIYAFAWLANLSKRRQAEELLTQAKQEAEAAARMKSDFLSNMSHEIRTPMNAIIGMTHLLGSTSLQPKQSDYLHKINSASRHLLGIINDILDISKIEAGKMSIEHTTFAMRSLVDEVIDLVADKARDKGLQLEVHLASEVPARLVGDPLRLSQILVNYLSNAIKFTPAGQVRLVVEVVEVVEVVQVLEAVETLKAIEEKLTPTMTLKFSVSDTGIGMSEETLGQLFQSFVQADASTTRRFGGTGLGLAISKQLARLMEGEVGVQSTQGQGTTFWFTAKLALVDERAHATLTHEFPANAANNADSALREGLRILVAEDNPINQQVAQEILQSMDAVVTLVDDGAQALEALRQHRFDLVLMDMQMPVMDGLQAARELRAMPGLATLPVLAMTANVMPSAVTQCLQAGMNDHLPKPIDPVLLRRKLAQWSGSTESREESNVDTPPQNLTIPGLDVNAGLRHTQSMTLYRKLLMQFVHNERDTPTRLLQAMQAGDWALATRQAHTLKGVAATLGAPSIAQHAAQLESLLSPHMKAGTSSGGQVTTVPHALEAACCALHAELGPLLMHIAATLETPKTPQTSARTDARALLQTIVGLAQEGDASALDLMQQHRELLEQTWPQPIQDGAELLSNYEFVQAAEILEAALTQTA